MKVLIVVIARVTTVNTVSQWVLQSCRSPGWTGCRCHCLLQLQWPPVSQRKTLLQTAVREQDSQTVSVSSDGGPVRGPQPGPGGVLHPPAPVHDQHQGGPGGTPGEDSRADSLVQTTAVQRSSKPS